MNSAGPCTVRVASVSGGATGITRASQSHCSDSGMASFGHSSEEQPGGHLRALPQDERWSNSSSLESSTTTTPATCLGMVDWVAEVPTSPFMISST